MFFRGADKSQDKVNLNSILDGKKKIVANKIQELTRSEMSLWGGLTSLTGVSKSIKLKTGDVPARSLLGPRKKSMADEEGHVDDQAELQDIVQRVVVEDVKNNMKEAVRIRDLRRDVVMDSDEDEESDNDFMSIRQRFSDKRKRQKTEPKVGESDP